MCGHPLGSLWGSGAPAMRETPWANWSECPISVGAFAGAMNGGPLLSDWVGTTTGFDDGWRVGWDVTPSWGAEMRFAFASLALYDSYRADQALIAQDNASGLAADDPERSRFDHRNAEMFQWDVDVLYYPWRETRLRPYVLAGIGLTDVNFSDRLGEGYHVTCLSLPLGIGVKYLCDDNMALRLDLMDDIAMSNQHLQTQNNLSLTAGLELRFGGSRKIYWPFDLSR
jgi:opacity protein-like surface antigen